jgi:hypothetical protein
MFSSLKNTWTIISVLSLVPLTTFFVKPDVALAGGFAEHCEDFHDFEDEGRYYLKANCLESGRDPNDIFGYNPTEIAISDFIANYNAHLSWAVPPGIFHKSCRHMDVDEDGILSADCKDFRGNYLGTQLDLNERISNQNGVLSYDQ